MTEDNKLNMNRFLTLVALIATVTNTLVYSKRPNILFILTDDQDVVIGGMEPITKTRALIGAAGVTFNNMFVTSPLCCPSRSSILTGNYVHNHNALNNSVSGSCSSPAWQASAEKETFVVNLKKQGYHTFFAGKYLNQYGKPETGGVEHVPPGWDEWNGLVGNSVYYNYTLSVNGKAEHHGDKYPDDYLTDLIAKRAAGFIDKHDALESPFFMMLSTPACHAPFTPAPQYSKNFSNVNAPTNGSFDTLCKDKHWLMQQVKHPMGTASRAFIHQTFQNRWRTLLTVDDMVENLVKMLEDKKLLDHTYIVFSSDNGYHLGQFALPSDKRQLYEFDIRVPLMMRGPGIKAGQTMEEVILNIDLGPTFIEMAGAQPASKMDGTSFLSLLTDPKVKATWRTDFIVEHSGEHKDSNSGCPKWDHQGMANCYTETDCVCEDCLNNTYACVRTISPKQNLMYCEFSDDSDFVEVYDLHADPAQLTNIWHTVDKTVLVQQNKRLVTLSICKGPSCRTIDPWPNKQGSAVLDKDNALVGSMHQNNIPTKASSNNLNYKESDTRLMFESKPNEK